MNNSQLTSIQTRWMWIVATHEYSWIQLTNPRIFAINTRMNANIISPTSMNIHIHECIFMLHSRCGRGNGEAGVQIEMPKVAQRRNVKKGHNCRSQGLHMAELRIGWLGIGYIVDRVVFYMNNGFAFYDHTFTNTYLVVYLFLLVFLSRLLCWICSLPSVRTIVLCPLFRLCILFRLLNFFSAVRPYYYFMSLVSVFSFVSLRIRVVARVDT
jgi:hypothetical protein